jgi:hypothetical protein
VLGGVAGVCHRLSITSAVAVNVEFVVIIWKEAFVTTFEGRPTILAVAWKD